LRRWLDRDEWDVRPFVAAAQELRRVHQIHCRYYQSAWSHGDLHLGNIIYDQLVDRAFLIDFDTRHDLRLSPLQRHADDLKVMLLELLASPDERWGQPASALIEECRDAAVLKELGRQLVVPRGLAKIFWFTRTNCSPTHRVAQRLQRIQKIIQRVAARETDGIATMPCRDAG